jgi:hypothetical protein
MFKKILFTAFLACFALSANAQIATPQLDAGFHTYGGAAAGWRYGSTINLVGLSAEGKAKFNDEEVGDVTSGMNAKGPEDSASPIPFLLAAYRGETFAGELYSNIADGLKTDVEMELNIFGYPDTINVYSEEKELRVNLAYVIGDMVSVGLGYSSISDKTKIQKSGSNVLLQSDPTPVFGLYDSEEVSETTTVGTSVSASFRLAEIFFIAAGMESVIENGTFKNEEATSLGSITVDGDYVENTWTNTMYGVAFLTGDPGETQFRAEYSMISSPESEKDAEGSKFKASHPQTTTTFATVEAKFSDFLIAYQSETEKEAELNDKEKESVKTLMGLGWQPMSGLTVSLYAFENKTTQTDSSKNTEQIFNPKGYRFFIGYNF